MGQNSIIELSATEMAALIRSRQLSSREVLAAHLAQIERVNPAVNAIVTRDAERASQQAAHLDEAQARGETPALLHGLPVAIKDLSATEGLRTTWGSRLYKDFVPQKDAIHVARLRQAGAIVIGKTNTPEFGAGSQTFNEVFGPTRNPWDLSKTCGGSSGGSAVSLACRMTPLADGTDNGGSLRNPAAFCNVIGFRPAPGRVPEISTVDAWARFSVVGPMARTVTDIALMLSTMAGPDPRCPISISEPGSIFRESLAGQVKGARVAWFGNFGGLEFDSRVRNAVNAQRGTFESLGCIVDDAEPDLTGGAEAYRTLRLWSFAASLGESVRRQPHLFKETIQESVARGTEITGTELARATALHTRLFERMRRFMEDYDFFIVPSTQVPPFDIREEWVREINGMPMNNYIDWIQCCWMITITEAPSISMPCGFTPEGLPVGLQIVGKQRGEMQVLRMAFAFEQATQFGKRRPPIAVE
jgi:amidase